MSNRPTGEARVTMYDVGFGDCFLLTVPYAQGRARQVLIDCGSHKSTEAHLTKVAEAVAGDCGGKLDAIVATHRHKDHISAFGLDGPADVLATLEPELAVQPWTEDPQAAKNAEGPALAAAAGPLSVGEHLLGLAQAQEFAAALEGRLTEGSRPLAASPEAERNLATIAGLNIPNRAAISWLTGVPAAGEYLYAGCAAGKLSDLLPGVNVRVLGPPTLQQTQEIKHEARSGGAEFWVQQEQALGLGDGEAAAGVLFPAAATFDPVAASPQDRVAIDRLQHLQADNVQWIVRSLDEALNNTSLILLFEIGKHRLLFAGDAQVENWAYALKREDLVDGLGSTTLYKVGHHGSGNATPRSMWERLLKREAEALPLHSLLSTEEKVYNGVPREPLLEALTQRSILQSSVPMRAAGKLSECLVLQ